MRRPDTNPGRGATLLGLALALGACGGGGSPDGCIDGGGGSDGGVPDLVFQSGFEPDTRRVAIDLSGGRCTATLSGVDRSVADHGDWDQDLASPMGLFQTARFCFGGGTVEQRHIEIVPDPEDPGNHVLLTQIDEPGERVQNQRTGQYLDDETACNGDPRGSRKARIQHLLNSDPGITEFSYRVRVRLGEAFQRLVEEPTLTLDWMTIGEYWNVQPNGDRARVTLNLIKPRADGPFYFGVKADWQPDGMHGSGSWTLMWPAIVSDVEVPIGEWFLLEVHVTAGDATACAPGHVSVHVTGPDGVRREVADVTGSTVVEGSDPDAVGFQMLNTIKLYTAGAVVCGLHALSPPLPLEAWWDDYELHAR